MDGFDADQRGNASDICEAQQQEDRYLRPEIHVQALDNKGGKDTEGPVSERGYRCVRIGKSEDDVGIDAIALHGITGGRPEEPDWLTLSDDLRCKRNAKEARKDHDRPDNPDMHTFRGQAK